MRAMTENQAGKRAQLKAAYDYIVVGAGASGCVVAGELSKTGADVLLIEAGGTDDGPTISNPSIWLGTAEVLLDDSLRLRSQDRVDVHTWGDMTHVFPSNVGLFEAAGAALDLIATFLRAELAPIEE